MSHPKYKLELNTDSFEPIITELFRHGFVFSNGRFKTMAEIKACHGNNPAWDYLNFGHHFECRMVVFGSFSSWMRETVTLKEFLKIKYYQRLTVKNKPV